jgi:hypothetical protein
LNSKIEAGGKKIAITQTMAKKYHYKVVAASNSAVTKVEVTYDSVVEDKSSDGKKQSTPKSHSGKSYSIEAAPATGALTITNTKGDKVATDEITDITSDFDEVFGKGPRMARIVANQRWTVGKKVALSADDLAILNESGDKAQGVSGSVTLVSKDAKIATFRVELNAAMKKDKLDIQLPDMMLDATVDAKTLRSQSLKVTGSMKGTVQGMPVSGTIAGSKKSSVK